MLKSDKWYIIYQALKTLFLGFVGIRQDEILINNHADVNAKTEDGRMATDWGITIY